MKLFSVVLLKTDQTMHDNVCTFENTFDTNSNFGGENFFHAVFWILKNNIMGIRIQVRVRLHLDLDPDAGGKKIIQNNHRKDSNFFSSHKCYEKSYTKLVLCFIFCREKNQTTPI